MIHRRTVTCALLMSAGLWAQTTICPVSVDTWGIPSAGKVAFLDYHYLTSTMFYAEVKLATLTGGTPVLQLPAQGTLPYYISYGYNQNHLAYVQYESGGGSGGGALGKTSGVAGGPGGSSVLYYRDLGTGATRQLVTNTDFKEMVWVGGSTVVWIDYRYLTSTGQDSVNSEVYAYDLTRGQEIRITQDHAYQERAFTDGASVVWVDFTLGYGRVFHRSIASGSPSEVAPRQSSRYNPRVLADRVVYEDYRSAGADPTNADIYMTDMSSGVEQALCAAPRYQGAPYLAPAFAVWEDYRNAGQDSTNADIYGWSFAAQREFALVVAPGYQGHPVVNGDTLVYVSQEGGQLYLKTMQVVPSMGVARVLPGSTRLAGNADNTSFSLDGRRAGDVEWRRPAGGVRVSGDGLVCPLSGRECQ